MNPLDIIERYSIKNDRIIKKICEPLAQIGIPYLWYYFFEEDGSFGAITNDPEYAGYYMDAKMHLSCPYYATPSNFRSGYSFIPSAFEEDYELIKKNFDMDHTFLVLKNNQKKIEGFSFYGRNLNLNTVNISYYLENIDLLEKFICYFKREVRQIIRDQANNQFNIKEEKGADFFKISESLPLSKNLKVKKFLKEVYSLSPQEERCHDLLKQGFTAQGTAAILNISRRTVEHHLENIKYKFKCNSKLELFIN